MTAAVSPRTFKGSRQQDVFPPRPANLQVSDIDSAFPLQEYIAHLVQLDPHDVDAIVNVPGGPKENSGLGLGVDEKDGGSVDESCWIYEQLRRLAQDLTHPLITSLQAECNRTTCPEMKAGEWLYLCVAHGTGPSATMEQCCAIDYITHTLDSATALLNSPRAFPSRLQIPTASTRQFPSLARRLSRIFAHAYYHHREAFEQSEAESSLYARFLLLAKRFDLVPTDFLVLPGSSNPVEPTPSSQPPSASAAQQQFQMPTLDISSAPPTQSTFPAASSPAEKPRAGASLPMQRSENSMVPVMREEREGPQRHDSPSYATMTIKSAAPSGPTSDADRRALLNRSRTDTMYMRDFDLTEFAAAAGDAMATVNAEDATTEPAEEEHPDDEDPFLEVEKDDIPEDEHEEVNIPIVTREIGTGAEEPAPTPGVHDPTLPAEPSDGDHVVAHVDEALETAEAEPPAAPEASTPAVEPSAEAGVVEKAKEDPEEPVHIEHGEVKIVPAHLGLESEADAAKTEEVTWGEPVEVEKEEPKAEE